MEEDKLKEKINNTINAIEKAMENYVEDPNVKKTHDDIKKLKEKIQKK